MIGQNKPKHNSNSALIAIQDGISQASTLINPMDAALVLLNHQMGLLQTVKDISITELRANTTMLAKLATLMNLPVITTASVLDGPLVPEVHHAAPHACHVPLKAELNAWDNDRFIEAIRKTGRRTLIMAGVWTSVCVMFPALEAKAAGFKVYAVTDASGDTSEMASRTSFARLCQAGVVPTTANGLLCELQRTWNWSENKQFGKLYKMVQPSRPVSKVSPVLDWQAARLHY